MGRGRYGRKSLILQVLTPRKSELKLYEDINEIDPRAFIISYEPKQIQGGFWVRQVRQARRKKENLEKDEATKYLENKWWKCINTDI